MANVRDLFDSIRSSLENGKVPLTLLGDETTGTLNLDEPCGLQRYAGVLRPQIQLALDGTRRERNMLAVLLVALFILAATLVVYDHLHSVDSRAIPLVVPGLGISAVWPLAKIIALNRQAFTLEVFPGMLPLLSRQQAAKLVEQFLSRGLS
jgi:hypothetical protein